MALSFYFYCSPYVNFFINLADDKLIGNPLKTPIKNSSTLVPTLQDLFLSSALILGSTSAHNQINRYINKNQQKAIQIMLDSSF